MFKVIRYSRNVHLVLKCFKRNARLKNPAIVLVILLSLTNLLLQQTFRNQGEA